MVEDGESFPLLSSESQGLEDPFPNKRQSQLPQSPSQITRS